MINVLGQWNGLGLYDVKTSASPWNDSNQVNTCEFLIPGDLSADLTGVFAQECERPLLLLTIFLEVLRRFTAETSGTVRLHLGAGASCDVSFPGHSSARAAVVESKLICESATAAGHLDASVRLNASPSGHFTFQPGLGEVVSSAAPTHFAPSAPIHCFIIDSQTETRGFLSYQQQVWERSAVESLVASYQTLLRAALANPDVPLSELEIVSPVELLAIDAINETQCEFPHLRVDELFEQKVRETPHHPAVTFEHTTLSYLALSDSATRLEGELRLLGVGAGALVAICMDRSLEMVSAMLAVFKLGAGYLPLDPAFPADRLAFMLLDAQPAAVITQPHLQTRHSFAHAHVFVIDGSFVTDGSKTRVFPNSASEATRRQRASYRDLAYVLYTSGSTGKPKGVQISHRALTNLLQAVAPVVPLDASDVFLATSTISFDLSVYEIFAPLIAGAHLVIASRSVTVSGELLAKQIRATGATLMQATPSGWRLLLEAGWQGQPGLKMLSAGEPLDHTLAARLLDRGLGLWNLYGPTEATIYATACRIEKDAAQDFDITVGRPLANYKTHVLDHNRKRLPIGAVGELYLGGIGLAQGYLNRPDLTAEKFIANPFAADPTSRLYRTGDLARFLPDGQIELLGRSDNQVKLRGYRIELEEIEGLLDSHPNIRKAVVKTADVSDGDQRLVAYVIPRDSDMLDEAKLREFASQSLPAYMVPTSYVSMRVFTLTPNGKVDRSALPAFSLTHTARFVLASDPAPDPVLSAVLDCWRSALSNPTLDADDNFFEVGGHSILVARVCSALQQRLGRRPPVSLFIEAPTARGFAERLRNIGLSPTKCLIPMQTKGSKPPLYLIHHLLGDVLIYRSIAECFAPDRPVFGIQPPPDFQRRRHPYSLAALVSEYIEEILDQHPGGPFHLAGFSSGSVLAFEMARQLTKLGHQVGLVALIDGDIPATESSTPLAIRYLKISVRKLAKIAFKFRTELAPGLKPFVAKRLQHLLLLRRLRQLANSATATAHELTLEESLILMEKSYQPGRYPGSALLIRFHDEAWQFGPEPLLGWQDLVEGGIAVADFPGGHISGMSQASSRRMADLLLRHIKDA